MGREHNEYRLACAALKQVLKRQKLTYRELARRLGLSESGVKKILTARDGSFQRIAQIAAELGIAMGELLAGQEEGMHDFAFSPRQQELLLREPRALRLYWALVYERRPLAEARQVAGLGARELFSLLRRLDGAGLLELLPGDRLRIPAVRQIRWTGGGPLVEKLYREWGQRFVGAVAGPDPRDGELFLIRYFRASRRTVEELIAALRDLEKEFVRRAIREMRTEAPDLVHLRWLSAVDQRSYLE